MRRFSLSVLLVAICLLPVGIGSGTSAHSHAVAALDGSLVNTAGAQAQVLEDYFSRARSIDLLTAHNPAFRQFYRAPGDRAAKLRAGGPVLDETNEALGYLETLFPDSIGEACFIDRAGPEIARMVRGERATPAGLSPDESGAPFFAPTFALRHGQVYQARPYVSPDTKEWVISNSALMPTADGSKQAIVHFEVTIESFRKVAASLGSRFDIVVVDARTGQVVLDSRQPQLIGAPLGNPDDHRFQPVTRAGTPSGSSSVDERPLAFQRLQRQPHNANDWYVLAAARTPVGPLYGVSGWSVALVLVALALLVFAAISFLAQHRLLVATSMTDALTGIPNRRQLKADLERGLKDATPAKPLLLMLFDLNGFKGYNDTFGHPAGDALLVRLATALDTAMTRLGGSAYRLGGDEFCILASVPGGRAGAVTAAASQALTEHGGGFHITASYGAILLPEESQDVTEAMQLVDQRMYAQKTSGRRSPDRQSRDVLLRALQERNPELAERHAAVARLTDAVGERMLLAAEDRAQLRQAAELHDIGKLALPEDLLHKPGPLDPQEWAFVRRHPLIGERIIGAAPALAAPAKLVRSTHERFDGSGYPDGLAGEQIPLGAQIIAVCDAFTAMTSPRAHAPQRTVPEAIAELRNCAGTQFDPAVVDAFSELIVELVWPPEPSTATASRADPVRDHA
ncbi:MAG TPA: HD domain-containing phosphohydrolase [Actinomycetes bacterium]|jgi:diguanylate cyclase (GGDEF)-like protein|nr:HD domain-containing phosphohydrolase [Actinomycetes bacterium]